MCQREWTPHFLSTKDEDKEPVFKNPELSAWGQQRAGLGAGDFGRQYARPVSISDEKRQELSFSQIVFFPL